MAKRYTLKRLTDDGDPTILDSLNPAQREAAATVEGPLLILAGAGSGKTRVITHRIAHMIRNEGISPDQILAVTFTNKAAGEMRERVNALLGPERADDAWRVTIQTFHSLCARLLRRFADKLGLDRHFVIYDESDQKALLKQVLQDRTGKAERAEITRLRDMIERHKNAGHTPRQAHEQATSGSAEEDAFFYEAYQKALRAANCVDFGDLILGVLEILRAHPNVASDLSNQWRYVMVDEFQDTNPAQYELLRHLTREHANVCVVGDDDQAIYRWRGATIGNILGFDGDFAATKVVKLEQNYRSTQVILDAANDVIEGNERRRPKTLWTERAGGAPITCFAATDDREEAIWVAGAIERERADGIEYVDMAVFYRTNAQARSFEEQLRFAGVPYQIIGGTSFYAREEVKDILAYLKVALNPSNEVDLLRILNKPRRGIGGTTQDKLRVAAALPQIGSVWRAIDWLVDERSRPAEAPEDLLQPGLPGIGGPFPVDPELEALEALRGGPAEGLRKFHEVISGLANELQQETRLSVIVHELVNTLSFAAHLESTDAERADDRLRNVHELVNAISEFENEEGAGLRPVDALRAFLDRSALLASSDAVDPSVGAVTLMTVHSSKGLEFDTVFLAGMEDGLFPSRREGTTEELEEERRLAYVAITRAKRKLYLSWAHRRRTFGEMRDATRSQFVDAIADERVELDPRSASRYSGYGQRDAGRTWGRTNLGRQRDAWDYDQSTPMVRGAVGRAVRAGAKPDWDEVAQPSWDEFAQDAWAARGTVEEDEGLVGHHCSHAQFGIGEVVAESGVGDMATITVAFAGGVQKKIKRKFLKIW